MGAALLLAVLGGGCASTNPGFPMEAVMVGQPPEAPPPGNSPEDAPPGEDAAQTVIEAMAGNARALRAMRWRTRTRVQYNGRPVMLLIHRVTHDAYGDEVAASEGARTQRPVTGPAPPQENAPPPEEIEAIANNLAAMVRAYTRFSRAAWEKMLESGLRSSELGLPEAAGADLLATNDKVRWTLDPSLRMPRALEFEVPFQQDRITALVQFRSLPDGPFYPSRAVAKSTIHPIQATIESFDFRPEPAHTEAFR